MIPFLHLGPLTIPTFGLMVATGLLVAAYILQARFQSPAWATAETTGRARAQEMSGPRTKGFLIIGIAGLAGLVGARLYHVLESPHELIANPSVLISRFGFAWFGGLLGGFVALVILAKRFRIPLLEFLDMLLACGSSGYASGASAACYQAMATMASDHFALGNELS